MRTGFAALLMALAVISPAAADDHTIPCQVITSDQTSCPADPEAVARWTRMRLKELDEQAATARLNRDASHTPSAPAPLAASAPPPPSPPPPRQAANLPAPPAPAQYGSALEEYRALREAYDRQLRAYYRAFPAQASVNTSSPGSATASLPAEHAAQDAARADAWHGYNRHDGPSNGY